MLPIIGKKSILSRESESHTRLKRVLPLKEFRSCVVKISDLDMIESVYEEVALIGASPVSQTGPMERQLSGLGRIISRKSPSTAVMFRPRSPHLVVCPTLLQATEVLPPPCMAPASC